MLKVPQLNDMTYEQIIQRAVSRIPSLTDQWTDFNSHDPGITVLQTYAWLVDMLNYYMDATGDVHVKKYLKLLGIQQQKRRAAAGYVVIHGDVQQKIPKGTRLFAGDISFETAEEWKGSENRFCSFLRQIEDQYLDLTAFAGTDGEYADIFQPEEQAAQAVCLGFSKPLQEEDRIYICVEYQERRNPFDQTFRLGTLEWQVFTEEGWKTVEVEDETCGFLRSGFVTLKDMAPMAVWSPMFGNGRAYYLKANLQENTYDSCPRIGMVYVNPLKVIQQHTVCKEGELLPELLIGTTDGCAGQSLLFDYPYAYKFSLAVVGEDGEVETYHYAEDLEEAGYKDRVFTYEEETQSIRFGDGIHGVIPRQNKDIYVTGLICSLCGNGNVQAGELNRFEDPTIRAAVSNPLPVDGGQDAETIRDMKKRMQKELFIQNRMASQTDYETIVKQTPGLMIDLVQVIPGKEYGVMHRQNRSENEVVVVVKPWSDEKKPVLKEQYRKAIEDYIEPYRLINTKVTVESARYAGICVHGKIALEQNSPKTRKAVLERISRELSYTERKHPFGTVISYGQLFTALENTEGVKKVLELNLERTGNAARKNDRGDVLLDADALGILEGTDLQFC